MLLEVKELSQTKGRNQDCNPVPSTPPTPNSLEFPHLSLAAFPFPRPGGAQGQE